MPKKVESMKAANFPISSFGQSFRFLELRNQSSASIVPWWPRSLGASPFFVRGCGSMLPFATWSAVKSPGGSLPLFPSTVCSAPRNLPKASMLKGEKQAVKSLSKSESIEPLHPNLSASHIDLLLNTPNLKWTPPCRLEAWRSARTLLPTPSTQEHLTQVHAREITSDHFCSYAPDLPYIFTGLYPTSRDYRGVEEINRTPKEGSRIMSHPSIPCQDETKHHMLEAKGLTCLKYLLP